MNATKLTQWTIFCAMRKGWWTELKKPAEEYVCGGSVTSPHAITPLVGHFENVQMI